RVSSSGDVRRGRWSRTIKQDLKIFDRLVRDRMVAAKVAIAFLQHAVGHRPNLPSSVKRLSLNQLARLVMGEANQSIPENFETRVWRPSLPVIHIASAVAVAISDREQVGEGQTSYGNLIADNEFIGRVLHYTREYEKIIKTNKLPINAKKLVSIQLVQ